MKGRSCIAVFFAIIALLFSPIAGNSKSEIKPLKPPAKKDKIKNGSEDIAQINQDGRYRVQRGDNLIKIARSFDTTPEALKSTNGLRSSRIKAGQILEIPPSKSAAAQPASADSPQAPRARFERYISAAAPVQAGDEEDELSEATPAQIRLVQAGFELIGVRYRFGGFSEKTGLDCSALVKNVFSKFNIDLPRSSREQFKQGEKVGRDELKPGDLVFFSNGGKEPNHVGIYVGNNKFLHAARKARHVIVSDLNKIWYAMRYIGARRITELWEEPESETE